MPGYIFHQLHALWCRTERRDEYFGTLVNAWLASGGRAIGIHAGEEYVDVGTLHGYRAAIRLLEAKTRYPMTDTNTATDEGTHEPITTIRH